MGQFKPRAFTRVLSPKPWKERPLFILPCMHGDAALTCWLWSQWPDSTIDPKLLMGSVSSPTSDAGPDSRLCFANGISPHGYWKLTSQVCFDHMTTTVFERNVSGHSNPSRCLELALLRRSVHKNTPSGCEGRCAALEGSITTGAS